MEKRKAKRRHLIFYFAAQDHTSGTMLGHVADITTDGMLVIGDSVLTVGTRVSFDVNLSQVDGLRNEHVTGVADVKWTGADHNPALKCMGLQFVDLGPRELANIDVLIKYLAID
jgi:hypothetical protein